MKRMAMVLFVGLFIVSLITFEGIKTRVLGSEYPTRPITLTIPYEAGSGADVLTRPEDGEVFKGYWFFCKSET